jgi:transcriptional regulator with XRE-family HTH domain
VKPDTSPEDLPPAKTWERRHAAKLGKAVQKQRGERSAVWLEQRTEQLGLKMTRQTVADLESGRRRFVTTGELLVLAAALNTTPIALMYPKSSDEPDNVVEVLPDIESTGFQAAQWFSGNRMGFTEEVGEVEADDDAAESDRRRAALAKASAEHDIALLRGWRQLDELHLRRDQIKAPKGGRLTPEELELLDFYNNQIESLRRLLQMSDGKSTGVDDHA